MFEKMRNVFGPVAVSAIIGAIALVFVFFGVYNPRTTRGMGSGALAATVNGDGITMQEYSRELNQRTEAFQSMMKGKLDPSILKQLHIGEQVVQELVRRRLVLQEAHRLGMTAPDAEVRDKIQELPYFKDKDGKFDLDRYNRLLEANHYTPAAFEDMIREDILRGRVTEFIRGRAKVSEEEIRNDFLVQEDRRQVDYVALNAETAKKYVLVTDKDIQDLLGEKAGLEAAKAHYERTKMEYAKPAAKPKKGAIANAVAKPEFLAFDEVKKKVATDLLRERRADEGEKANKEIAKELAEKAKTMKPEQFKSFVKSKGLEVKTSAQFNRMQNFVPGVGELPDLIEDAFKEQSPLAQGPKLYEGNRVIAIAMELKSSKPDLANLAKQHDQLAQAALGRKSEQLFQSWLNDVHQHSKISINKGITQQEAESAEN